jgi:deoxyribonuclease V
MVKTIDLYKVLIELVKQIPESMVSTPYHLSVALGDSHAAHAVSNVLKRGESREALQKVVEKPAKRDNVFCDFSSDEPLKQLAEFQLRMSKRVILKDVFNRVERFAGVDAAYLGDEAHAVCIVMDSDLNILESTSSVANIRFPYIPGYLMFREAPVIEEAVKKASELDVLFVNGHGVAHPRGCGLATCVGLDLGIPVIGVAKRNLIGTIGNKRDVWAPILYEGKNVGAELSIEGHHPIYVSVGHRISLETSVNITLKMMSGGRLPEPLRQAHIEASRKIKSLR